MKAKATTVDVSTGGRVDLAAYFVRRGFDLLRPGGNLCFITTNTIGQGDTREASLTPIATTWGGELVDAVRSEPWEGEATVSVAIVHIHRGPWEGDRTLDGRTVDRIAADLSASQGESEPVELAENDGIVSVGTNVLGEGFWIDADERRRLIDDDPRNADVIKPFIGGRQAMQASDPGVPIRWVIDFGNRALEEAETYAGPMEIIRVRVKPQRERANERPVRDLWWKHGRPSTRLYERIHDEGIARVIAIPHVSKTMLPVFLPANAVYQDKLFVFVRDDDAFFGFLTSSFHWLWAAKRCTTMRTDPTYNPSQIFMTLARPRLTVLIDRVGGALDGHRREMMLARQEGLTDTYNRVFDAAESSMDVVRLRELHQELDRAVADAYGWSDLQLDHGLNQTERFGVRWLPCPAVQQEIVRRLLALNLQRATNV